MKEEIKQIIYLLEYCEKHLINFELKVEDTIILKNYIENLHSQLKAKEELIEELKKWLEDQKEFIKDIPVFTSDIANNHLGMIGAYNNSLNKIQELEILSKGENK